MLLQRWSLALQLSALLASITACVQDNATEPPGLRSDPQLASVITGNCMATGSTVWNFIRNWSCRDSVRLDTAGAGLTAVERGALESAVGTWNTAVLSSYQLPRFTLTNGNRTIDVQIQGTGTYYCGSVPIKTVLSIVRQSANDPGLCSHPGTLTPNTLAKLFVHELSHSIGFQAPQGAGWHKPSDVDITGHCASALYNGGRPLNSAPCQHELEALYAAYGLRTGEPDRFKHVLTGLQGLTPLALEAGETATLRIDSLTFSRANGTTCNASNSTSCLGRKGLAGASFSWSAAIGGIVSLTGSGSTRTVTGLAPGADTVRTDATAPAYDKSANFGTGASAIVNVTAMTRPTSLAAGNITPTSAQITWTNGESSAGTTTIVEYRITSFAGFNPANGSPVAAGVSNLTLSGLHCGTSYDVNIFHRRNGVASSALTLTLFITGNCQIAGVAAPTGYHQTTCSLSTSGGKQYATYGSAWTPGSNPAGSLFQIGSALSNNSGVAAVIATGLASQTSRNLGPYLVTPGSSSRYFWVRHVNGGQASSWAALTSNPIVISQGCIE